MGIIFDNLYQFRRLSFVLKYGAPGCLRVYIFGCYLEIRAGGGEHGLMGVRRRGVSYWGYFIFRFFFPVV